MTLNRMLGQDGRSHKYDYSQIVVTRVVRNVAPRQLSEICYQLLLFLICVSGLVIFVLRIHNYYPVLDPIGSVHFLDRLSLLFGAHRESAILVIDIGQTFSTVFCYIFQSHNYDGTFHISSERSQIIMPSMWDSSISSTKDQSRYVRKLMESAVSALPTNLNYEPRHQPTVLIKFDENAMDSCNGNSIQNVTNLLQLSLSKTPFKYSIGTMDSWEEESLQWFTINLLSHNFNKISSPRVYAYKINVAEEHIEVTLASRTIQSCQECKVLKTKLISAFGKSVKLVKIQIPHLGLYRGRQFMLSNFTNVGNQSDNAGMFHNPCLNPMTSGIWSFRDNHFKVFGKEEPDFETTRERNGPFAGKKLTRPVANIEQCSNLARRFLTNNLGKEVQTFLKSALSGRPAFMGGLLEVKCMERGLTLPNRGGHVDMKGLQNSLIHACKVPNMDQPFACMDLVYLKKLLEHVFNFQKDTVLHSAKKINHMTGEWPLAAAFHAYVNGI